MGSPRERMLRLLSLLQTGRQWPATDLTQATGSTPRTLRRDIEFLRELGYPVQSIRGPGGHYQLVAGRALPPLMLEDDEAIATVLGLRLAAAGDTGIGFTAEAAGRAGAKLQRLLPAKLRRTVDDLLTTVDISAGTHPLPSPGLVKIITRAIAAHEVLSFAYTSATGTAERQVEPARLLRIQQRWYLFAWDRDRMDWRTFRLDRIDGDPAAGERFSPRSLPAEDMVSYLREHFRGVPELTVVLTLHTSTEDAASRLYRIDGTLEPLDDTNCRYTAHVDSYEWLTLVLTLTDIEFTVNRPDEFRRHLTTHTQRLVRATRRMPDG